METLNVLFVCNDNTSRSAAAEVLARKFGSGGKVKIVPKSAGMQARDGSEITFEARTFCTKEAEIPEDEVAGHTSKSVNPELAEWADVIIVMTLEQKQLIRGSRQAGKQTDPNKIFLLSNYVEEIGDTTNLREVLKFMRMVCQRFRTEGKETLLKPYRAPKAA